MLAIRHNNAYICRITDITASGVGGRETSRAPAFRGRSFDKPHSKSGILNLLAPQELVLFADQLRVVELTQGQVLAEQYKPIELSTPAQRHHFVPKA